MSRRATKDTCSRPCDAADARKRLGDAEKYLEVAQLVAIEDSFEAHNVAAGLAVLAGIAAADAACCKALNESSRGPTIETRLTSCAGSLPAVARRPTTSSGWSAKGRLPRV